jgi:D-beta-D-heptose 7-phosphate kinase/D-beta-D-heptose 1-phosphate adenosyltransferase
VGLLLFYVNQVKWDQLFFTERNMTDHREVDICRLIGDIVVESGRMTGIASQDRILKDDEQVKMFVTQAKHLRRKVVLTQGTFDLVHIGHARYVREASKFGDLLIVGVDDDEKARDRKGENRPVVPFVERAEILCHFRYVDAVVAKRAHDPKWHLIRLIEPDILIAVEGTYSSDELAKLEEFCGKVVVLTRQAETSTSAKVRKLVLDGAESLTRVLVSKIPEFVESVYHDLKKEGKA